MSYYWSMKQSGNNYQVSRKDTDGANEKAMFKIDAGTGGLLIGDSDVGVGEVRLFETGAGENYVALKCPASGVPAGNIVLLLPSAYGSANNGQILSDTDGSGTLGWTDQLQWLHFGYTYDLTSTSNVEMRTINGADNGHGYRMPRACRLKSISVQFDVSAITGGPFSTTFTVFKNSTTDTTHDVVIPGISGTGDNGGKTTGIDYAFAVDDTVMVKAKVSDANMTVTNIAIILEIAI
jgi:hypothetical protein